MGNRFLSATGSRLLAFGYMRYGRPTLVTAGLLVHVSTIGTHLLIPNVSRKHLRSAWAATQCRTICMDCG